MPKFFVPPEQVLDGYIRVYGEDAKHIGTVLRLKKNDKIIICDGQGTDYECIINTVAKDEVLTEIATQYNVESEPNLEVVLFQGLPKLDKMEWIIQKAVELGVSRIIPVLTERTVVKIEDDKKSGKKQERWNKISEAAAKQSGRGIIPEVSEAVHFKAALQMAANLDLAMIPYEKERNRKLRNALHGFKGQSIGVFIGPEGGFTESEMQLAREAGIQTVTLGNRILRTETAGLMVLSIIMYEIGEM